MNVNHRAGEPRARTIKLSAVAERLGGRGGAPGAGRQGHPCQQPGGVASQRAAAPTPIRAASMCKGVASEAHPDERCDRYQRRYDPFPHATSLRALYQTQAKSGLPRDARHTPLRFAIQRQAVTFALARRGSGRAGGLGARQPIGGRPAAGGRGGNGPALGAENGAGQRARLSSSDAARLSTLFAAAAVLSPRHPRTLRARSRTSSPRSQGRMPAAHDARASRRPFGNDEHTRLPITTRALRSVAGPRAE